MDKKACGKNDQRWSVTVVIVQLSYERVLYWTLLHGTSVVMIIPRKKRALERQSTNLLCTGWCRHVSELRRSSAQDIWVLVHIWMMAADGLIYVRPVLRSVVCRSVTRHGG